MDELLRQLTDLFHRLRTAGMPLGLDELMSLQRALHQGFGLADQAALKRLCRLVWLVSPTDQSLFDYHYNNAISLNWPLVDNMYKRRDVQTATSNATSTMATESTLDISTPPVASTLNVKMSDPPVISSPIETFNPQEGVELAWQLDDIHVQAQVVLAQTTGAEALMAPTKQTVREFLPIARRELLQSWRYLRRMVRSGPAVELDTQATVYQAARDGYLVKPVVVPRRTNQSTILLLLDQKGSMVPFHFLCRALAETATAVGSFGQVGVYYFHNTLPLADLSNTLPAVGHYREHLLYTTPQCVDECLVSEAMHNFTRIPPDVLIFSDAGAARKSWNATRIEETALFLFQLRALGARQFVWLNPLPPERWVGTSAAAIAEFIPMLPLDSSGFSQAILTLNSGSSPTLKF